MTVFGDHTNTFGCSITVSGFFCYVHSTPITILVTKQLKLMKLDNKQIAIGFNLKWPFRGQE